MFNKRSGPIGICFNSSSGKHSIEDGDKAELHIDDVTVLVNSLIILDEDLFQARVYGFEPFPKLECNGLKKGHLVTFNRIHIFSCNGP